MSSSIESAAAIPIGSRVMVKVDPFDPTSVGGTITDLIYIVKYDKPQIGSYTTDTHTTAFHGKKPEAPGIKAPITEIVGMVGGKRKNKSNKSNKRNKRNKRNNNKKTRRSRRI